MAHLPSAERIAEIMSILSISRDAVERWTKDARTAEKKAQQNRAWDLWLDCLSERETAEQLGVDQKTAHNWIKEFSANADFSLPPASRQHFDVWQFATADKTAGAQSYFGAALPPSNKSLRFFF